jgi:hypothetical protein
MIEKESRLVWFTRCMSVQIGKRPLQMSVQLLMGAARESSVQLSEV